MTHHDDGQLGLHQHSYDPATSLERRYQIQVGAVGSRGWLVVASHSNPLDAEGDWFNRRQKGEIVRLVDTKVDVNERGTVLRSTEATGANPDVPRAPQADALTRGNVISAPFKTDRNPAQASLRAIRQWQVAASPLPTLEEWEQLKRLLRQAGV